MCGIVVVVNKAPINRGEFDESIKAIKHRGPDAAASAFFENDRIGFGHCRLSILDLSENGNQPMWDYSRDYCITFNGEIFNYQELRLDLAASGWQFKSNTDTEVLLALYARDRSQMTRKLRGMYAFAIWDAHNKKIFLARDPMGIKPLYIRKTLEFVAIASEPSALKAYGPTTVDPSAIIRSFMFSYSPGESFGLNEIKRLPAGANLEIDTEGSIFRVPAGSFLPDGRGPNDFCPTPTVDDLYSEILSSVREHLVADVPIGIMFSGGLDSSLIAACAAELGADVRLYAVASDHGTRKDRIDSPKDVKIAAQAIGLPLTIVEPPTSLFDNLESIVSAIGEPIFDGASYAASLIAKRAKEDGVKVLLAGHGADEIFAGYRRHLVAHYVMGSPISSSIIRMLGSSLPQPFGRIKEILGQPSNLRIPLLQTDIYIKALEKYFSRDFLGSANYFQNGFKEQILAPFLIRLESHQDISALRQCLWLDFGTYLTDQNLNHLDKITMMHGVEGRLPFLHHPIVSLASNFKAKDLIKKFKGKWPLRELSKRLLPSSILKSPKAGFGLSLEFLIRTEWEKFRDYFSSTLQNNQIWSERVINRAIASPIPNMKSRTIMTLATIQQWQHRWRQK